MFWYFVLSFSRQVDYHRQTKRKGKTSPPFFSRLQIDRSTASRPIFLFTETPHIPIMFTLNLLSVLDSPTLQVTSFREDSPVPKIKRGWCDPYW